MSVMFPPSRRSIGRKVVFACVCALSTLMLQRSITAQRGAGDTPSIEAREAWPLDDLAFRSAYTEARTKREAAARLARFPGSVNTVAWLARAGRTGDALDVLQRVIAGDATRIADGLKALDPVISTLQRNQASEYNTRLSRLLDAARARLPDLDRESAARLELAVVRLDSVRSFRSRQQTQTYQGTLAARLAAVDDVRSPEVSRDLAEYDAIALREGTNEVAAKARFEKATALLTRFDGLRGETGHPDPTDAWLEVLTIVRDLESGRYPAGPWVDEAVTRVSSFSLYQKMISPGNAARLLPVLRLFVVEHEAVLAHNHSSIVGLVTQTMPAVAAFLPDGAAVMERQFIELGRELRDPAAALYLKALWMDSPGVRSQPMALPPGSLTHEGEVRKLLASAAAATAIASTPGSRSRSSRIGSPGIRRRWIWLTHISRSICDGFREGLSRPWRRCEWDTSSRRKGGTERPRRASPVSRGPIATSRWCAYWRLRTRLVPVRTTADSMRPVTTIARQPSPGPRIWANAWPSTFHRLGRRRSRIRG
jgi:hypothetical protein